MDGFIDAEQKNVFGELTKMGAILCVKVIGNLDLMFYHTLEELALITSGLTSA